MTTVGPAARAARAPRGSPGRRRTRRDVRKSQRSTKARSVWRRMHDHLARRGGDLRRAAGAGQPHPRRVVVADHGGVDVAEAVDLRGTEEPDVDPARLQPVGEDLGHRHDGVGGLGQLAVADRQRQAASASAPMQPDS